MQDLLLVGRALGALYNGPYTVHTWSNMLCKPFWLLLELIGLVLVSLVMLNVLGKQSLYITDRPH